MFDRKQYDKNYYLQHKVKRSKQTRKYYRNNKTKCKELWLKGKYGLRLQDFKKLLTKQKNKCKICGTLFTETLLPHVDHNHKTGKIRGILCQFCNHGLGNFRDNSQWLRKAAKYLECV